jgi:hypothetical protein
MGLVHQGGEEALSLAPDEGTAKAAQDRFAVLCNVRTGSSFPNKV